MKYFGLLDCNNFFVSCERLFRPDLIGKPTLVLSNNDGCVVARSQEVKDLGIPMGVPYFKVKDEIQKHNVTVFSGNHQLYRDISRRVMNVLKRETTEMKQYSVDEAFFVLKLNTKEEIVAELKRLKDIIETEVGVPVSVGAGKTMTIAKYASEKEKKGAGVCALGGDEWSNTTSQIKVGEIWGIGGKTASKMKENKIYTVADFLNLDKTVIDKMFGLHGVRLASELSERPVNSLSDRSDLQKSIMHTRSLTSLTNDYSVLEEAVNYHVTRACESLRQMNARAGSLRVQLGTSRHGDFLLHSSSGEVFLTEASDDTITILHEALHLLSKLYKPGVPYKKTGVILGNIETNEFRQANLFTNPTVEANTKNVMSVLDDLNKRFGTDSLTLGRVKRNETHFSNSSYRSHNYTTSWEGLVKVST